MEKKRVDIIQGMRFIAAIAITLFHAGVTGARTSSAAVELFFVISGYVAMLSSERKGPENPFKMFARKMSRIIPLYWGATILMYILISVKPELSILSEASPEYLIKSLFFIPFMNSKGNMTPILGCGWTLIYEVLFIIIFCITSTINFNKRGWISIAIIAGLVAIGQFLSLPLVLEYYFDSVLLEFAFGILLYYLLNKHITVPKGVAIPIAVLCLSFALYATFRFQELPRCLVLGIPMAVVFFMGMSAFGTAKLPNWIIQGGNCSFEIYIIEYFSTAAYKVVAPMVPPIIRIIVLSAMILLTLAISYCVHIITEKFLRCATKLK